jgi:hypothetical protein
MWVGSRTKLSSGMGLGAKLLIRRRESNCRQALCRAFKDLQITLTAVDTCLENREPPVASSRRPARAGARLEAWNRKSPALATDQRRRPMSIPPGNRGRVSARTQFANATCRPRFCPRGPTCRRKHEGIYFRPPWGRSPGERTSTPTDQDDKGYRGKGQGVEAGEVTRRRRLVAARDHFRRLFGFGSRLPGSSRTRERQPRGRKSLAGSQTRSAHSSPARPTKSCHLRARRRSAATLARALRSFPNRCRY